MGDILKLTAILAVVCALNGLALGVVYEVTKKAIDDSSAKSFTQSLTVVLPKAVSFSREKSLPLPGGGSVSYHEGYDASGAVVGYALSDKRQGYQSVIKIMVGIDPGGVIQGLKVIEQAETPGLGARVEEVRVSATLWDAVADAVRGRSAPSSTTEPWFQEQFRGLTAGHLAVLKATERGKGIHAITGATVTSRALTAAVRESIDRFMRAKGGRA
ncbi:MAG: FMN-binding protein [Candidatus Aureabacteria bacterium]|nr:FMN-binding protein [Candidatus Auribacterota bacterium]